MEKEYVNVMIRELVLMEMKPRGSYMGKGTTRGVIGTGQPEEPNQTTSVGF